jgi:putative colanic acid biosynthesis acetyltransferase WcaF
MKLQRLDAFALPKNFRGRPAIFVQLWWVVHSLFFRNSPQVAYGFRRCLLRIFGAKIGRRVIIRPSAVFTYPWKIEIGDHAWIGDDVVLYSLAKITIGPHAVISQRSYLCGGDHDYTDPSFPIRGKEINIGEQAWIAADVFIAPGVTVGAGTVIGARSSVFSDMPEAMVCVGYPCKPLKKRQRWPQI